MIFWWKQELLSIQIPLGKYVLTPKDGQWLLVSIDDGDKKLSPLNLKEEPTFLRTLK